MKQHYSQSQQKSTPHVQSKTQASVTLHGSVPIQIGDTEVISLAGSATIIKIGGKKFLVDLGMFQGGEASDYFNTENIDFLKNVDGVIITHAHIDHIGRLPLLYKLGYRGRIYMTYATSKITHEMLLDSCKIQEGEMLERQSRNKNLGYRLKQSLKIKSYLGKGSGKLQVSEGEKRRYLKGILGENYDSRAVLQEVQEYLDFYNVRNESDIQKVLENIKATQYDISDVENVMSLIQTIEKGEARTISSRIKKTRNFNHPQQDILNEFPKEYSQGYRTEIPVGSQSEIRKLNQKWEDNFSELVKTHLLSDQDYTQMFQELQKQLEISDTYIKTHHSVPENTPEYEESDYAKHSNFLELYGIHSRIGIDTIAQKITALLENYKNFLSENNDVQISDTDIELIHDFYDRFDTSILFHRSDIKEARKLLKVDTSLNTEREMIGIGYYDAAHIVGSASIVLVAGSVKKKVSSIMELNGNSVSIGCSGDLGRIEHNRLGTPDLPPAPLDYIQVETTYGGKEHRNREESVQHLLESIIASRGNVLISVFSQQRCQEILQTLLESKRNNEDLLQGTKILVDAPLAAKISAIYSRYAGEYYDLLKPETQIEVFGEEVFRYLKQGEWQALYGIESIEMGEILEKSDLNPNEKHIILASSGMMDGGAIMNHLPHILGDETATLLAPGYLSEGTIGNEIIIQKLDAVTIAGEKCEVLCNTQFIDGFSSHIGHTDILLYIRDMIENGLLKQNATIALNHGSMRGQKIIQSDIESILEELGRADIQITIPDIFEEYNISEHTFQKDTSDLITSYIPQTACVTPTFLLKETAAKEDIQLQITQADIDQVQINKKSIHGLKNVSQHMSSFLSAIGSHYLGTSFAEKKGATFDSLITSLSRLGDFQRSHLIKISQDRLHQDRVNKSHLSKLKKDYESMIDLFGSVSGFFDEIKDFFYQDIPQIKEEIKNLETRVESLHTQREGLSNEFNLKKDDPSVNTDRNSSEYISYDSQIRGIKNRISSYRGQIDRKQNTIKKKISNFQSTVHSFGNSTLKNIFFNIINTYKQEKSSNYNKEDIIQIIQESILDLKSQKESLQEEISTKKPIEFIPRGGNFSGENVYDLMFLHGSEFNIEYARNILGQDIFSDREKEEISELLKNIEEYDMNYKKIRNTKTRKKHIDTLKKYLKTKQRENADPGVEYTLDIEQFERTCLKILEKLFTQEYFSTYIQPHFNIYLFIKADTDLKRYIEVKYDLTRLKGYKKFASQFEEAQDQLSHISDDLHEAEKGNERYLDNVGNKDNHQISEQLTTVSESLQKIVEQLVLHGYTGPRTIS
ncbi:MBL fold metallo-hydrolase [Candidatus Gracilibacteria bacterium]|nr:MBL fold metallo-hydrolase [Candidatus Gracilibacteria bacterium]